MYKAKFAFEGQEGEMSLKKDDLVELVEKDNNGWWLVKKDGVEGWAPNNYLELVPPKPKAALAPPPPPPPPPANKRPPSVVPTAAAKAVSADPSAKPVAVFPGMAAANGSAAPWKRTTSTATNGSSADATPAASRPGGAMASKPPPVAAKPKPGPPPIASKPGVPGKPPVPTATRPSASAPKPKAGGIAAPATPGGQLDLAAAVSRSCLFRAFLNTDYCMYSWPSAHSESQRMNKRSMSIMRFFAWEYPLRQELWIVMQVYQLYYGLDAKHAETCSYETVWTDNER